MNDTTNARQWWAERADQLLAGVRAYASENGARITLPGAEGGYGRAVDGLEGFARTLLIAGFRIAGERGEGLDDLIDFYARGIAAGVNPDLPDRWVRPTEHAQAKVESASIALVLDMTRPWIWDRFDELTKQRVIDYLAELVGDATFPRNNWCWFRIVTETFLRSVGGPWSQADIDADLALHESFVRDGGWISDGDERAYDNYVGWALHLYPVIWARMQGADELMGERKDLERLDAYLRDALTLIGADGAPLFQGRSLIYRFAAAAPFWAGIVAGVPSSTPGELRHAAEKIVGHFFDHGAPDERDLLTMGWFHEWRTLAQRYSGPGSPYWAAKGFFGLVLPADHPVWAAPAERLPVERGDVLRAIEVPGWLVSGTADDGIVRVINHGTDHALPGDVVGDSPLYTRIGYSTVTAPLLDEQAWRDPVEQSVAVLNADGVGTHRAALNLLGTWIDGDVGIAGSSSVAHWLVSAPPQPNHGSGLSGEFESLAELTVWSLVRGPWEIRLARLANDAPQTIRVGGWPLVNATANPETDAVVLTDGTHTSFISALLGTAQASVSERPEASALGAVATVPTVNFSTNGGEWIAVLIGLSGHELSAGAAAVALAEGNLAVTWPDGTVTSHHLDPKNAMDAFEVDRGPSSGSELKENEK